MSTATLTSQETLDQAKAQFDRDGYTVIRGFLNPEEVEQFAQRIDFYIEHVLPHLPPHAAFYEEDGRPETLFRLDNLQDRYRWGHEVLHQPRFVELAGRLLDDVAEPKGTQMFGKAPRIGKETPAHQDGYYFKLVPNEALTMWLPLDRTDEQNGCIRYVPGSHRGPVRPHGTSKVFGFSQGITDYAQADFDAEHVIVADPGDLIVHHSLTIHRADPNQSDRRRWALGMVHYAQRAKPDIAAMETQKQQLREQWRDLGKTK